MNDFTKNAQMFAEPLKALLPEVKFNKNGYEIRTQMLELAQTHLWQDYHSRWGQFELNVRKEDNKIVTKMEMPEVPGVDQILNTAQKFYDFVNVKK